MLYLCYLKISKVIPKRLVKKSAVLKMKNRECRLLVYICRCTGVCICIKNRLLFRLGTSVSFAHKFFPGLHKKRLIKTAVFPPAF